MALARSVIDLHAGELTINSTVGKGTRVTVRLPVDPAPAHGRDGAQRMRHTVLVVDDEASIADGLRLTLEAEGYSVRIAGSVRTALAAVAQADAHVAIVDLMLPDGDGLALTRELKSRDPALEVIVITAYGSVRKAMEATKGAGAFHVVEKPFEPDEVLGLVKTALEHRKLVVENTELRRRLVEQTADSEILGSAPGIQRVMETIASVADTDANVLIIGESGTGKELIANALHERSARRDGPWIKINCAALPKDLIESELFGHTKGSFTGATTEKVGLLEEAHKGSLLLDEITEMPIDLQAKLLRVLEERVVRRLGGAKSIPVDFRLLSSTNRSPEQAVEGRAAPAGPLLPHQHRDDRGAAAARAARGPADARARVPRALSRQAPAAGGRHRARGLPAAAAATPGRATCASCSTRSSARCWWPAGARSRWPICRSRCSTAAARERSAASIAPSEVPAGSLEEIERASILKALDSTRWNKQAAAALLGLRRPTLYSKMRKHNIPQRRPD